MKHDGMPALPLLLLLLLLLGCAAGCAGGAQVTIAGDGPGGDAQISAGLKDGLEISGPDGVPRVHLGGRLSLQHFQYDSRNTRDSGARIEHALVRLDGEALPPNQMRLEVDLDGRDTRSSLKEAWISHERSRALRATAGLLRVPMGIEDSIPETELAFLGHGFPAMLNSRTDLGVRLDGELASGFFSYDLTASAGEGFDASGARRGDSQLSVRTVIYPLTEGMLVTRLASPIAPIGGLFFSASYAHLPSYWGRLVVPTQLRNKLFILPRISADRATFYHIGYGIDAGRVRWIHETTRGGLSDIETAAGEFDVNDQITAWAASLSWMLTGEQYDTHPYRQRDGRPEEFPRRPLFAKNGEDRGVGAVELALRYANADIDRRFFNLGLTSFAVSSQEFRTLTTALNWYPDRNLRLSAELVRTIADQTPATFGGSDRDTSWGLRVEYIF